jgi:GcrA cell cycle regulator
MMLAMNENSVWKTPGLNERLRELHARDGSAQLSMSMLAEKLNAEFGTHLTRNAIVGRCRRLSLPGRPAPLQRTYPQPKSKPGPKPMRIVRIDAPIMPYEAVKLPEDNALTIYQLGHGDCRWPLGAALDRPPFLYCGHVAVDGRPYCSAHCAKAYNAPAKVWA